MGWKHEVEQTGQIILRQAVEANGGKFEGRSPMVLSCGGIFVPRPRPINPRDPLYHILNVPGDIRPVKIVSALVHRNILQEVLAKESLN